MKTTLKRSGDVRWQLFTFKVDHRPLLATTLTRLTIKDGFETFRVFQDNWTIARIPCTRATANAIAKAHDAATPAALAIIAEQETTVQG